MFPETSYSSLLTSVTLAKANHITKDGVLKVVHQVYGGNEFLDGSPSIGKSFYMYYNAICILNFVNKYLDFHFIRFVDTHSFGGDRSKWYSQ